MTPEKLINEYQAKVAECDKDIDRARTGMGTATDEFVHNRHRDDMKVAETKRQAYFQMVKDLEDLA